MVRINPKQIGETSVQNPWKFDEWDTKNGWFFKMDLHFKHDSFKNIDPIQNGKTNYQAQVVFVRCHGNPSYPLPPPKLPPKK